MAHGVHRCLSDPCTHFWPVPCSAMAPSPYVDLCTHSVCPDGGTWSNIVQFERPFRLEQLLRNVPNCSNNFMTLRSPKAPGNRALYTKYSGASPLKLGGAVCNSETKITVLLVHRRKPDWSLNTSRRSLMPLQLRPTSICNTISTSQQKNSMPTCKSYLHTRPSRSTVHQRLFGNFAARTSVPLLLLSSAAACI